MFFYLNSVFGSFLVKERKGRERKGRERKRMEEKGKKTLISHVWYKFSLSFRIPPLLGGKESEIY